MRGQRRQAAPRGTSGSQSSARGPLATGLALVLVAGATTWLAGTAAEPERSAVEATSPQRVARSLSCVTGLSGGRAVVGSLHGAVRSGRPAQGGVVRTDGDEGAFAVQAGKRASASVYATQSAQRSNWYAAQACADPSRVQWFLGAGGGRAHQSTLTLTNTRSGDAIVDVEVFGPKGVVEAPGLDDLTVRASPTILDLSEVAPSADELSVRVTAQRGLVSATMVDRFSPGALADPLTEFIPGQAEPATTQLIGGMPAQPDQVALLVHNTGDAATVVGVEYAGVDGHFTPKGLGDITAPPGQLTVAFLPRPTNDGAHGVRITTDQPVVAGLRVRERGDVVQLGALAPLGATALVGLPVGADRTVRLLNPDDRRAGSARVDVLDATGKVLERKMVVVPAGSVREMSSPVLRGKDARVVRIVRGRDLRGAIELRSESGLATIPVVSVAGETRVPAVQPAD